MNKLTRRGLLAGAGLSGLAAAAKLGQKYGLVPPDCKGIYGPGETLTYAAHRILGRHAMAREFSRAQISNPPFANEHAPLGDDFKKLEAGGFADWRLAVDGMVARPQSFTVSEIKKLPQRSQITSLACEEGWSYIAEWTGTPLRLVLEMVLGVGVSLLLGRELHRLERHPAFRADAGANLHHLRVHGARVLNCG